MLRIVAANDVIGDAEHVEAGLTVGIDELTDRLRTVAPGRVGVELAQQRSLRKACHTPIFGRGPLVPGAQPVAI